MDRTAEQVDQEPGGSNGETVVLSVVIACYNAERTLGLQLTALAEQPCPVPWEVLVCDNGSTDGSRAVALSFEDRLPLRVLTADQIQGPGAARNVGARAARGRWLGFCDADDVVADDWLAQLCDALDAHSFVAGRFEGSRLNSARTLRSRRLDQQTGLQFSDGNPLPHAGAGNMGIHLEIFRAVGGFDTAIRTLEDSDLCWRIQQTTGEPLIFVPELCVHVRLRSGLPAIFRQGREYGAAYHQVHGASLRGPASEDVHHRRRPLVGLTRMVGSPPSLGHFIWQVGWWLGHGQAVRRSSGQGSPSQPGDGRVPQEQSLDAGRAEVDAGDGVRPVPLKVDHAA